MHNLVEMTQQFVQAYTSPRGADQEEIMRLFVRLVRFGHAHLIPNSLLLEWAEYVESAFIDGVSELRRAPAVAESDVAMVIDDPLDREAVSDEDLAANVERR
jgi:hypothetical protein